MKDKNTIQAYINRFRKELGVKLRPDIGVEVIVHPIKEDGAILELVLGINKPNSDHYEKTNNKIGQALKKINQHAFEGELANLNFGGTNILAEKDRIILIKGGDDSNEWEGGAAKSDVERLVSSLSGGSNES
jgi:hypothetical protein